MNQTSIRIHDVEFPYELHNSQELATSEYWKLDQISQTVFSLEGSSISPGNEHSRCCMRAKCGKEEGYTENNLLTSKFNRTVFPLKEFGRRRSFLGFLIPVIVCIIVCWVDLAEGAVEWRCVTGNTTTFETGKFSSGYSKGVYAHSSSLRYSYGGYNRHSSGSEAIYGGSVLIMILCSHAFSTFLFPSKNWRVFSSIGILMMFILVNRINAVDLNPVEWRWMSGSSITNQNGVCGTAGQYSTGYTPGGRYSSAMTAAYNGHIYLFGGSGYPTAGGAGDLGDVWMNHQTCWSCKGEWTWLGGKSDSVGYQGEYAGSTPYPGGRHGSIAWFIPPNQLHVHGGYGRDGVPNSAGYLSDIWSFNTDTFAWTWLKGSSVYQTVAVFGTKGTPAVGNVPGGIYMHMLLTSKSDSTAIIFCGYGYDAASLGFLSDTWKYTSGTTQWTWISGPGVINQQSTGGTSGVYSSTHYPGGRYFSAVMDTTDLVYLFGGDGKSSSVTGRLADLWAYNTVTNEWAYIAGESTAVNDAALGSYGSFGSFSASNHPGSRYGPVGYSDLIMVFGGYGYGETTNIGYLNDFWTFNVSTKQWSWASGDSVINQNGNYADSVWFSSTNKPGGRKYHTMSVNNDLGLMYLFGGYGYPASGSGYLNDFWATKGPTVVVGVSPTATPAISPTASPTASPTTSPTWVPGFPTTSPTVVPPSNPTPTAVGGGSGTGSGSGMDENTVYLIIGIGGTLGLVVVLLIAVLSTKRGRAGLKTMFGGKRKVTRTVVVVSKVNGSSSKRDKSHEQVVQQSVINMTMNYNVMPTGMEQSASVGGFAYALHTQEAQDETQLNVQQGDVMKINQVETNGWAHCSVVNDGGETTSDGWYPVSWLQMMDNNPFGQEPILNEDEMPLDTSVAATIDSTVSSETSDIASGPIHAQISLLEDLCGQGLLAVDEKNRRVQALLTQEPPKRTYNARPSKYRPKGYTLGTVFHSDALKTQLRDLETFWTSENVMLRQGPAISDGTFHKTRERVLGYLGFLRVQQKVEEPTLGHFMEEKRFEAYLDYLREARKLEPGTVAQHCQSVISVLKHRFASSARRGFGNIDIIQRYMARRNALLRERASQHAESWEGRVEEGRWLHWEEVLDVVKRIKDEYEAASADDQVTLGRDYLALLLYTALPPGRAKELYTSAIPATFRHNPLTGNWEMGKRTSKGPTMTKTERHTGAQLFVFDAPELDFVVQIINTWVNELRPQLAPRTHTLFVNDAGQPYTSPSWSAYLQGIFARYTSQSRIAVNSLRSALVTHFYGTEEAQNPQMRESLAITIGHSERKAKEVYDRRTVQQKKRPAVQYMARMVRQKLGIDVAVGDDAVECILPAVGDIVAVVSVDSQDSSKDFMLGKVLRIEDEKEILLGHLKAVDADQQKYVLEVGAAWFESVDSLVWPVDVQYEPEERVWGLKSSLEEIVRGLMVN